jgi:hypothetical protein
MSGALPGVSPGPSQPAAGGVPQPYDERLTVPRSWWVMAVGVGVSMALILFPFGPLPMLAGLAGGAVLAMSAVSSYGSVRIRVVAGTLVAGKARIPVTALGRAVALDPAETTAWRTYKADQRAFMLLRSYVATALKVEVTDPGDPTPYLYLSTRSPERLAQALQAAAKAAARAETRAAGKSAANAAAEPMTTTAAKAAGTAGTGGKPEDGPSGPAAG